MSFHSLKRLRNETLPNVTLNAIEQRIHNYVHRLKLTVIETIQQNNGIDHWYQTFLNTNLPPGLYAMDYQRFYTPIDEGLNGCYQLVSVPKEMVPLYGLSQFKFAKIFFSDKYIIIFAGCIGTHGNNRFLSQIEGFTVYEHPRNEEWHIIPTAGAKPVNEINYVFKDVSATVEIAIESSDTEEDSDCFENPGFN